MININQIFIYPTDTIYGIGCNATNKKLVDKIRKIKKRTTKPFSIIAPSKKWILENFEADKKLINKYLPGPYTLILKRKNPKFLKHISKNKFVGVRIPDCPFTKKLQKTGKPVITTSVNISGQPFATKISEIDKSIFKKVDKIFDVGELSGRPSTLVKQGKEIKR